MKHTFIDRLNSGEVLVADGSTGTNYQAQGLPPGVSPETWVFEEPDKVVALHRAFIDAGSDIILTCSFGGNTYRLHGSMYAGKVDEVNETAALLSRKATETSERQVFVAGSMGPTGQMLEPFGTLSYEDAANAFAEQAAALTRGGVDFLLLETFFALEEIQAAIEGVRRTSDLPLICSFSYDRGGRTMMGVSPAQMVATVAPLGVVAVGANCGTTLENTERVVRELVQHSGGLPVWAKPNAGKPEGTPARFPVSPEEMGQYARRFVDIGARIVGGCCGNTPEHVRAIAKAVRVGASPKEDTVPS